MTAPGTRTVSIKGSPAKLAFPPVCANCGNATRESLYVEKVVERSYVHRPTDYFVWGLNVPFCGACQRRHRAEVAAPSPARFLTVLRSPLVISAVGFGGVAVWLAPTVLGRLMRGSTEGGLILGAFVAGFALLAMWCLWAAWAQTLRHRVAEATPITRAFDFGDDRAGPFEREWHAYQLANPVFADAFAAANADRLKPPD